MDKKKVLTITYYTVIACLAVAALLLIVSALPITGNYKLLTVRSGSMEPAIGIGSLVVVKPAGVYNIGDIISFRGSARDAMPITHRIVDMRVESGRPLYITQGDANDLPDRREVREHSIVGKVLINIPYLGYAVEAAKHPFGFAIIVVVPAAIIISDELKKIWREIGKTEKGAKAIGKLKEKLKRKQSEKKSDKI